jgi:hypothetical protein
MKFSLKLLALMGATALIPAAASASIIYVFTATSADCLACGNTGPQPLPTFTLVVPTFLTGDNTVPLLSFLAGANLGASTYLFTAGTGPGGHDLISVINSFGSYDYDFAAGTLSKVGGPTAAVVGSFDGFSQTGFVTVTNNSPVPEPSTALLLGFPAAFFLVHLFRRRAAGRAYIGTIQCSTKSMRRPRQTIRSFCCTPAIP